MQKKVNKNFKVLKIKQGEIRSRFIVDLKEKIETPEFLEKIPAQPAQAPRKENIKIGELAGAIWKKIECLAVISLFNFFISSLKRIGKFFYKICYGLGWTAVFLGRFLYLLVLKILKPIVVLSTFLKGIERKKEKTFIKEEQSEKVDAEQEELIHGGNPYSKLFRQTASFALVLFILILPLKAFTFYRDFDINDRKGKVLGASEEAISDFFAASKSISSLDLLGAKENFSDSGKKFLKAKNELDEINGFLFALASVLPNKELRLASQAKHILSAGKAASDLGRNLTLAFNILGQQEKSEGLKIALEDFTRHGSAAVQDAGFLKTNLDKISIANLPENYREKFSFMREKSGMLEKSLKEFVDLADKLKNFVGISENKRYLLVFQNNSELRATGGFIGSFAIIDFRNGKIANIEAPKGGSYDTEAGLKERVVAPEPLSLVNPLWHFWDANWWPHWPTSAKKLEWFYEKSDGSTVDGVISLTPTVIEKVLEVIGPIDMTRDYGVVITAENFWLTTQRFAEQKPDVTREPKKIIGDLLTKIVAELPSRLDQEKILKLLKAIQESLDEKHVLFYFHDENLQRKVADFGWDGAIKNTPGDYLSVVNTNIGGGKSDRSMKEKISHQAEIAADGTITDTVKIERTHTGYKNEEFSGVRNVDWMRIYVPSGSRLLEAQGFRTPDERYFEEPEDDWKKDPEIYRTEIMSKVHENSGTKIYQENSYTVFANWSMVDPGETAVIYLKYELPFKLKIPENNSWRDRMKISLGWKENDITAYSLLAQKQAGARPSSLESNLKIDDEFKIVWHYPKDMNRLQDGWQLEEKLDEDRYFAVLLQDEINR